MEPIEQTHPSLAALHRAYDLDQDERRAVADAYWALRGSAALFIVDVAARMLPDLVHEVRRDPEHRIVFLGRDGHSFAAAVRALAPAFFAAHCSELVLSRTIVDAAIQDLEASSEQSILQVRDFRDTASRVDPASVPGAFRHLTHYLHRSGVPAGLPGSHITLVDNSLKGTVQELLTAAYPETTFTGRYAFFIATPEDPHPGTKHGYVIHQEHGWRGRLIPDLPVDPALTFANVEAMKTIEDIFHGPLASPFRWTKQGPLQRPQRDLTEPLRGLNPAVVADQYQRPRAREAVKAAALLAVHDAGVHLAAEPEDSRATTLASARVSFTRDVRAWVQRRPVSDPRLQQVLDSFARRIDRPLNERLADAFRQAGVGAEAARSTWQQLAALGGAFEAKERLVATVKSELRAGSSSAIAKARLAHRGFPRPPGIEPLGRSPRAPATPDSGPGRGPHRPPRSAPGTER